MSGVRSDQQTPAVTMRDVRDLAQSKGFQIRIARAAANLLEAPRLDVCYFSSDHIAFNGTLAACFAFLSEFRVRSAAECIAVRCTDCSWHGFAYELKAEACPDCDGRVGEEGSAEFATAAARFLRR